MRDSCGVWSSAYFVEDGRSWNLRNVKTFDQSLFRAGDYGAPNICRFDFLRKNNWERKHWADEPSLVTKYKKNINSLLALNAIP